MRKGGWGEIKLKRKKFTNCFMRMMLMAEKKDGIKSMLFRLERYLDRKELKLKVNKTRIMRFRKVGQKKRRMN